MRVGKGRYTQVDGSMFEGDVSCYIASVDSEFFSEELHDKLAAAAKGYGV